MQVILCLVKFLAQKNELNGSKIAVFGQVFGLNYMTPVLSIANVLGIYQHEFEQALGVGDGQGILACCSPWSHKELDMTEQLNWS